MGKGTPFAVMAERCGLSHAQAARFLHVSEAVGRDVGLRANGAGFRSDFRAARPVFAGTPRGANVRSGK
jgi:hypothetical protein